MIIAKIQGHFPRNLCFLTLCSSWWYDFSVLCSKSQFSPLLNLSCSDYKGWWCRVLGVAGGVGVKPTLPLRARGRPTCFSVLESLGRVDWLQILPASGFFPRKRRQAVFAITFLTSAHTGGSILCSKSWSSWGLSKPPSSALQIQWHIVNHIRAFSIAAALFWRSLTFLKAADLW